MGTFWLMQVRVAPRPRRIVASPAARTHVNVPPTDGHANPHSQDLVVVLLGPTKLKKLTVSHYPSPRRHPYANFCQSPVGAIFPSRVDHVVD